MCSKNSVLLAPTCVVNAILLFVYSTILLFCLYEFAYSSYCMLSGIIQFLTICVWLISLTIMLSGSIHIVAHIRISVLFYGGRTFHCMYILHLLLLFKGILLMRRPNSTIHRHNSIRWCKYMEKKLLLLVLSHKLADLKYVYSVTVLHDRNPKLRCWEGLAF